MSVIVTWCKIPLFSLSAIFGVSVFSSGMVVAQFKDSKYIPAEMLWYWYKSATKHTELIFMIY